MNISPEEFRAHYESLSDGALLEVDAAELVPVAQKCLAAEIGRRGLRTDAGVAESAAGEPVEELVGTEEELVCVAEYDTSDEADLAIGLLKAAKIAASLEIEPTVVRLVVPASQAEAALQMLVTPLSDEELAAQAEAAGFEEELEEEEPGEE